MKKEQADVGKQRCRLYIMVDIRRYYCVLFNKSFPLASFSVYIIFQHNSVAFGAADLCHCDLRARCWFSRPLIA